MLRFVELGSHIDCRVAENGQRPTPCPSCSWGRELDTYTLTYVEYPWASHSCLAAVFLVFSLLFRLSSSFQIECLRSSGD